MNDLASYTLIVANAITHPDAASIGDAWLAIDKMLDLDIEHSMRWAWNLHRVSAAHGIRQENANKVLIRMFDLDSGPKWTQPNTVEEQLKTNRFAFSAALRVLDDDEVIDAVRVFIHEHKVLLEKQKRT